MWTDDWIILRTFHLLYISDFVPRDGPEQSLSDRTLSGLSNF